MKYRNPKPKQEEDTEIDFQFDEDISFSDIPSNQGVNQEPIDTHQARRVLQRLKNQRLCIEVED